MTKTFVDFQYPRDQLTVAKDEFYVHFKASQNDDEESAVVNLIADDALELGRFLLNEEVSLAEELTLLLLSHAQEGEGAVMVLERLLRELDMWRCLSRDAEPVKRAHAEPELLCQIALAYSSLAQVGWPDPLRAKLEKRLADLL